MIYVVKDDKILNRIDAWILDGEERMKHWIESNGYVLVDIKITLMGNMVMTVE